MENDDSGKTRPAIQRENVDPRVFANGAGRHAEWTDVVDIVFTNDTYV